MKCINLKEQFGDQCRVELEDSYFAEHGPGARVADSWLMLIPCLHGHICPWGGDLLAACTDKRGPVAKRLSELPFTTVVQDGDDGVNVKFHVRHFDQIAEVMKPKRRRRLSAEHRKKLLDASRPHWFVGGNDGSNDAPDDLRRTPRGKPDTLVTPRAKVAHAIAERS